ncbi:MAG: Gfo/Idh/MocA family oxidoreductase [Geminicoccaceae bacterium]|nr:Gfo/Idh/MocA family oxidoreductase [Geminicoccaceae bacterium]
MTERPTPAKRSTRGVGLVGSGFMGRSHALAYATASVVFPLARPPRLAFLADANEDLAARAARELGFARHTGDWRTLVADPEVDLVDVTAPNRLHKPIALEALKAGKPVYCEKPLAPTAKDAKAMADAAAEADLPTFVGFNYLRNPMSRLAREIVESGEIGEPYNFRGIHAEDYMSDPAGSWTWRLDPKGGGGAAADLGSHIIAMARFLMGPIERLTADLTTRFSPRPDAGGTMRPVEVDDEARALVRFQSGAVGTIEASWIATGRKMHLAFEITGTRGSIRLNMERMNELRLYVAGGKAGRGGYALIPAGPEHPDYAPFCPAPGHQLGFNEVKAIEVKDILAALSGGPAFLPDFGEAAEVQAVVDAVLMAGREGRWVAPQEAFG